MNPPKLEQHTNGRYYIHWVQNRRSARVSTGHVDLRGALLFYSDWVAANIDVLFPPTGSARLLRQLHRVQGLR